jgi:hypothetical protein
MDTIAKPLRNKLILLIEADCFLAGYIGDSITGAGAQILGPARTVDEANALIGHLRQAPHAAVVSADIFEASEPVMSDAFARLGIPLLLTVGRARKLLPSSANRDVLMTPFAAYQVVDHLRAVLSPAQADQPMPPVTGPTLRGH